MAKSKAKKQAKVKLVQTEKIVRKTHFSIAATIRIEQAREGLRLVTQQEIDELEAQAQARFEARYAARRALGIDRFAQYEPANDSRIEAYIAENAKKRPARASRGGAR